MRYLLDTNICIALLNANELTSIVKKMKSHRLSDVTLCSVVKGELLYGAMHSREVVKNLANLEKFFGQFVSLPFDDRAAHAGSPTRP